jgi:hypothetical protein
MTYSSHLISYHITPCHSFSSFQIRQKPSEAIPQRSCTAWSSIAWPHGKDGIGKPERATAENKIEIKKKSVWGGRNGIGVGTGNNARGSISYAKETRRPRREIPTLKKSTTFILVQSPQKVRSFGAGFARDDSCFWWPPPSFGDGNSQICKITY